MPEQSSAGQWYQITTDQNFEQTVKNNLLLLQEDSARSLGKILKVVRPATREYNPTTRVVHVMPYNFILVYMEPDASVLQRIQKLPHIKRVTPRTFSAEDEQRLLGFEKPREIEPPEHRVRTPRPLEREVAVAQTPLSALPIKVGDEVVVNTPGQLYHRKTGIVTQISGTKISVTISFVTAKDTKVFTLVTDRKNLIVTKSAPASGAVAKAPESETKLSETTSTIEVSFDALFEQNPALDELDTGMTVTYNNEQWRITEVKHHTVLLSSK